MLILELKIVYSQIIINSESAIYMTDIDWLDEWTHTPTSLPTETPTRGPTTYPTDSPTFNSSIYPSRMPSVDPTSRPATMPSISPTAPTNSLTLESTHKPSL